ncbi:MAG TPA: hypothetical protein VGB54_11295 [Allosphingosinicella sp.]|jgi:hypothetical protein
MNDIQSPTVPARDSEVVRGAVIAFAAIAAMLGFQISGAEQSVLVEGILALFGLAGLAYSIYGRITTQGARPLSFGLVPRGGSSGPLAIALLAGVAGLMIPGCATLTDRLNLAERGIDVGEVLVNAAEASGLIDASTAERVRGHIRTARSAIVLARLALDQGNRARAEQLASEAITEVREAEEALRHAAPPEAAPVALNRHVAELRQAAQSIAEDARR